MDFRCHFRCAFDLTLASCRVEGFHFLVYVLTTPKLHDFSILENMLRFRVVAFVLMLHVFSMFIHRRFFVNVLSIVVFHSIFFCVISVLIYRMSIFC